MSFTQLILCLFIREYVDTMIQVDHNIKKVVENTENYFGKDTTAYIFTSDHGMTDWGSHGSGSTDETETPFVAWGAGIAKDSNAIDIKQADITPLISALAGIPVPVNNEVKIIFFLFVIVFIYLHYFLN